MKTKEDFIFKSVLATYFHPSYTQPSAAQSSLPPSFGAELGAAFAALVPVWHRPTQTYDCATKASDITNGVPYGQQVVDEQYIVTLTATGA